MTRQELIQLRDKTCGTLIAAGWDEDDARFATMTAAAAAAKPQGILEDQIKANHPALVALAQAAQQVEPYIPPVFRSSPDSLYDADHDHTF